MRFTIAFCSFALVTLSTAITSLVAPLEGYAVVDMQWSGTFNGEVVEHNGTIQVSKILVWCSTL